MSAWNVRMEVRFDETLVRGIKLWLSKMEGKNINKKLLQENSIDSDYIKYLQLLYDQGYGLKIIAREIGTSYSKLRTIFSHFGIKIRKGRDVSTEITNKFRSERVRGIKNPWSDTKVRERFHSRGIQGIFVDRKGRRIWLRSTWEYIFAKWLDNQEFDWDYEKTKYILENGESYTPDFTIYEGNEIRIIEIKGYLKDKQYKVDMLRMQYGLNISIIDNISDYCESYNKELCEWKHRVQKK